MSKPIVPTFPQTRYLLEISFRFSLCVILSAHIRYQAEAKPHGRLRIRPYDLFRLDPGCHYQLMSSSRYVFPASFSP